MSAQTLTAVAAVAAAIISLVNVALTAFFARRHDEKKWLRDLLPELIEKFSDAVFQYERTVFQTDWMQLSEAERSSLGSAEFEKVMELRNKLDTFASPATISAASDLEHAAEEIRMSSFPLVEDGSFTVWHPVRRDLYWAYAEAQHKFLAIARTEMGLKRPPVPPGLARRRESIKAINKNRGNSSVSAIDSRLQSTTPEAPTSAKPASQASEMA